MTPPFDPGVAAHLTPHAWATATRELLRKAIAEFTHERLLSPVADGNGFTLTSDDGTVEYRFAATKYPLDHWDVDAASIERRRDASPADLDALEFVVEFHDSLGIPATMLPVYLEEISSTLGSAAFKLAKPPVSAAELATADFQVVEAAMTEGHPCFVANNGRLGFAASQYRQFAPETGQHLRLGWIAVRRDRAGISTSASLDYDELLREELGDELLARFAAEIAAAGADPEAYALMPVHPWQWDHKLAITFAAEIATGAIIALSGSDDAYQPQQSIRTFFNATTPRRRYVKTSLSILNMGFMRGLSPAYMAVTPAINDWLSDLLARDEVLRAHGFSILREVAAVGYHNRRYEAATERRSPYRKMLSALWRESPVASLRPGERLATMAALLHVDNDGRSLAAALIRRSGLTSAVWLRRYLDAYLVPLVHCLYTYELAFMPHGENVILVLRDDVPVRVLMKDIAEEIMVMGDRLAVPEEIDRIHSVVPDDEKPLTIFTDVFDCIYRFLVPLLDREGLLRPEEFWAVVADCIRDYQAAHPELAGQFEKYDLFAEEFALSCLNRLQLRDNQQMVDLEDMSASLQFVGTLANPLAPHRTPAGNADQVAARTT